MLKIALLRNSPRGSKVMLGAERIILAIAEGWTGQDLSLS
jgi:hypothetical protein